MMMIDYGDNDNNMQWESAVDMKLMFWSLLAGTADDSIAFHAKGHLRSRKVKNCWVNCSGATMRERGRDMYVLPPVMFQPKR